MKIPLYTIDAFTEKQFAGNPAAVCPLLKWLSDDILQSIAAENNLSETAFFVRNSDIYELRWFTPTVEVDLCGHATLASAHVIFTHLDYTGQILTFKTNSGNLYVKKKNDVYLLDFPPYKITPIKSPQIIEQCLGTAPAETFKGPWFHLAVFENEETIKKLNPDFNLMEKNGIDVIVTSKGSGEIDFVSRCFVPNEGIPEDPVTGSAHCALVPYWSDKLGKTNFHARQVSKRGGELYCEYQGDRVIIGGKAVTYSIGHIILDKIAD